ncbi:unnamed protein product [Somion occarium]|uniref:Uncharacterized protein n=1 Tax=Somion occarium TaxID=3059160 RepID=A0ABP1D522_9APHY
MSVEVASNAVASQHESISSVSKPYLGDLRLPAYRVTHLGRYHPYGRKVAYHATSQPVDLMQTQDHRFTDYAGRPSLSLSIISEEDEDDIARVEHGIYPVIPPIERLVVIGGHPEKTVGFMEIIIDFALAMRRRFRRLATKRG